MHLYELTAFQIREKIKSGATSAQEVTKDLLDRIKVKDPEIGSYLSLNEKALLKAQEVDDKIKAGKDVGVLAGVPIAIKDNICTVDLETTCASKALSRFLSPYNAHVVDCIEKEDGVIIGKTNLDEFAMGSTTEHSAFNVTRNPWDLGCIPGGSSGGSAASVAADISFLSLGSDTGGSVRQPASFCGVVGFKPTYGRVSRYGLVAFASSLDQIGLVSKDVRDTALLLEVIAGHDKRDSTSLKKEGQGCVEQLDDNIDKKVRIGVPKEFFTNGLNEEISNSVNKALDIFRNNGVEIVNISLPHSEFGVAAYYIISAAEASSNLARYDGVRYGYRTQNCKNIIEMYEHSRSESFGNEVKRRIIMGNYVLSTGYYDAYYLKASKVRTLIIDDFNKAFEKVDYIISPTTPVPAYKIGEKISDPLEMYLLDTYTIPASLAGIPGISIPCGFTGNGLPIGLQIMGRHHNEHGVLQVARIFERETDFHKMKPKFNAT